MFPIASLNDWKRGVVAREVSRSGCLGWYRNPSRAAVDSLAIAYRDSVGSWRSVHPDFIFFNEVNGRVRASLVDPHGHHLGDAKTKLAGIARFAQEFGGEFHRIESLSKIGTTMKVLDLQDEAVREALIKGNDTPIELYQSDLAVAYDLPDHR